MLLLTNQYSRETSPQTYIIAAAHDCSIVGELFNDGMQAHVISTSTASLLLKFASTTAGLQS